MLDKYTDKEVIDGIRNDNREVLAFLYRENFHAIAYYIYSNSGSEQEAKDICQEAVIILYEKLKGDAFELNCSIKTFLYAVCKRLWLKRLHYKSRYVGKLDEYEELFSSSEQAEAEEKESDFKRMEASMNKLGEPCRTLLEDYYVNKLTMTAISEKFGYTNADNAKNQKYKCLMRLKKLFFNT